MSLTVNQGPVSTPTPDNAVLLLIDHQLGLAEWVRDQSPVEFKNAVMGLARTAKTLGIPVIITTSRDLRSQRDAPAGATWQLAATAPGRSRRRYDAESPRRQ